MTSAPSSRSALAGVRVIDMSRILAGPWASQLLADLGADVIKIERPLVGDDTRGWGPPFLENGDAAYFACANRNKRAVAIDITHDEGRGLVRDLAREADVFLENFKAGGLARYGLDFASLNAVNPRLVYCSLTGFGQTGPRAEEPGYDALIQAMGGLMSITGQADGPPTKVGVAVTDLFAGMYAASGILAALLHARATGEGQHLDVALFDCQLAMLANQAAAYLTTGVPPGRRGDAHPSIVPYQTFETADGAMMVAVGNDAQFARFAAVVGAPDAAQDARYATNAARVENRAALIALLAPLLKQRPSEAWAEALGRARVPCGPVNDLEHAFADKQTEARGLVWRLPRTEEDGGETVATPGCPVAFSATPAQGRRAAPSMGQDTDAVLQERLDVTSDELDRLRDEGVIA